MDFNLVIQKTLSEFKKADIHYALIGGFALGMWGVSKATVDVDFLVLNSDMDKVDGIMKGLGYQNVFHSGNVSQYSSPVKVFGEVDFLHAYREASVSMLENAEEKKVFGGKLSIKVARPEDLIGLKIQAIANDETRLAGDLADIESLMALYKEKLDWDKIGEYFSIFEKDDMAKELRRKYLGDK